jgi:hypothetical protein
MALSSFRLSSSVVAMADRLYAEALQIMAWSRVADLRTMADETAELTRQTLQPNRILPVDAIQRERVLAIRLLQAEDRARPRIGCNA